MNALSQLKNDYIHNITGYSSLGIILSTCLGSIAVMQALSFGNGLLPMFLVFLTVAVCGAHNAAILSVQKPLMIYRLLLASTVINTIIIAGSFLF